MDEKTEESRTIADIEEGLRQADAGNFATDREVRETFAALGLDLDDPA